jgi:hypothetical protein
MEHQLNQGILAKTGHMALSQVFMGHTTREMDRPGK